MPGFTPPPAPAVVLEGDYSDWIIYDSFDDTNVVASRYDNYGVVNKDETVILLIGVGNLTAKLYTIATKTLGPAMSDYDFPPIQYPGSVEGTTLSIQGTYVCGLVTGTLHGNGIAVWKDGVIIKTFSAADLGLTANAVYSVSISKSGKYIVVSGTRSATGDRGWVVLVGE